MKCALWKSVLAGINTRIDCSFTYANTVATIDFSKRYKGHGWLGIRYQLDPDQKELDEIILHVTV